MMEFAKKLEQKSKDLKGQPSPTIAVIGDSITQGCFEVYATGPNSLETVFEPEKAYGVRLKELLHILYPNVPIQLIPAGISGDSAAGGVKRLERDVLRFHPDLTVVAFGTNDAAGNGVEGIASYGENLRYMFRELKKDGGEVIFLTQVFMNTKTSPHLKEELFLKLAEQFAKVQNSGLLKAYYEEGKRVAREEGVLVCDLYSVWEAMANAGVDTTALLSNHLNHPFREYHYYIAIKLLEMILGVQL